MHTNGIETGDAGTTPAEEGRRARKARATRRALLDAGFASFQRQPISLVSVLDITEAADVAKGVFYLHFASKDDFLIELWLDVQEAFLNQLRSALATLPAGPPHLRDRLAAAIAHYAEYAEHHPAQVTFLLRMSSFIGEELGQPGQLTQRRHASIESLARVITGAGEKARLRKADLATARSLDASCWGHIWQALQLGQRPPQQRQLIDIVLRGVAPSTTDLPSQ